MDINGRMKVKTLKSEFKSEFGLTLRVYDGCSFAGDDVTLASIRKGDSKGGEFSPRKNTKIGNFEEKVMEMFGIKVQIAGTDGSYLCDNDLTLAGALEEDGKKLQRKEIRAINQENNSDVSQDRTQSASLNESANSLILNGTGEYQISDFRFFVVNEDKNGDDFIEFIVEDIRVIKYLNIDTEECYYYNPTTKQLVKSMYIAEIADFGDTAALEGIDKRLVRGLFECAEDEDGAPLDEFVEENGGEAIFTTPYGDANEYSYCLGVIVSTARVDLMFQDNKVKITDMDSYVNLDELLGYYDEEDELAVIYSD